MIYHLAIGCRYLHIQSNCATVPNKIVQCNDEYPHMCLESSPNEAYPSFPLASERDHMRISGNYDEIVHCQGSVLFHNRICTCPFIDTGDRNGYWSISVSHEVQTGKETIQHGNRDNMLPPLATPLDYCPCTEHTKTTLSLDLLRTCKKIHQEAALIPYESNTFIFQDTETYAAFFGLVFPVQSDSNENPRFASDRSDAIYNMRHIRVHSRALTSYQSIFITRLLRASLSLLGGLQTFELTLGLLKCRLDEWWIDDSLFGVSPSVKKVTVNIRDYMYMAREIGVSFAKCDFTYFLTDGGAGMITLEAKEIFAKKLIKRMLKKDKFRNEEVKLLALWEREKWDYDRQVNYLFHFWNGVV